MTKKILKASLLQRMISRFSLMHYEPEEFLISETVVPVTLIDEYLQEAELAGSGSVAVSATANYTFFTVPAGKRWIVLGVEIYQSTGTYTFNAIVLGLSGQTIALYKEASGVTTITKQFGYKDVMLYQGNTLGAYVNSFTGAGNAIGTIYYIEEDLF